MKHLLWIVLAVLMGGCATDPDTVKHLAAAQAEFAKVKTLTLTCEAGCSASYTDPRDRPNLKMPTNGWDVANTAINRLGNAVDSAIVPAAMAAQTIHAVKALRGTAGEIQAPAPNQTVNGNGVIGGGTGGGNASGNAVIGNGTGGGNTTVSGNGVNGTGNTGGGNVDTTHEPTVVVVEQPEPVLVEQPAPIIVTP